MVVSNIHQSDDEATALIRSFGASAYVCHPLIYQGQTIGTISFGTCDRISFTSEELDLMQAVTDLVASAMARKKTEDSLRGTSQYPREPDQICERPHRRMGRPGTGSSGLIMPLSI